MVFFKCKMCGGTVEFEQGATVGVCDSCGTKQTLPRLDDDKKANLYDRANHFRRNSEYDKAMGIYEQILAEDNTDAEAYWSLVLCRYGIEYVEDPATHKRVPTVNRAQYMSVSADEDYKSALKYADAYQRAIYEQEAKTINEIQKGILEISSKEEPFDIFISYKETDESGRRTPDSVLANDLYHQLTNEGFKVFFSRITLEDKLGTAYEPYIFSALNSAKVMVVIGTKPEYFNAVWVKNEWSRYLALVKKSDGKKTLITAYRDMDPYDLPEEFSHLQAQDMSKLGFMQDLIRGIKKIVQADEPKPVVKETVVVNGGGANVAPLLKRVFMFLEDSNWQEADEYCEKVLDQDPENAQAYLGKLMAEMKVRKTEQLADCKIPFDKNSNYEKILRFGNKEQVKKVSDYIKHINERNEFDRKNGIYERAVKQMKEAASPENFETVRNTFQSISDFKDACELATIAENSRKDTIYNHAAKLMAENEKNCYVDAIKIFNEIPDWRDAKQQIEICNKRLVEIEAEREAKAEALRIAEQKARAIRKKIITVTLLSVFAVVSFMVFRSKVIVPSKKYNTAMELYNAGKYSEAAAIFNSTNYKDCKEKAIESIRKAKEIADKESENIYNTAMELFNAGKYSEAAATFKSINYKDSMTKAAESIYNYAVELYKAEKYSEAATTFKSINYKDSAVKADECLFTYQRSGFVDIKVGKIVKFGFYEQDNNKENGKEEIEWQVLAVENKKALLISKYALNRQEYNTSYGVTWESCVLRKWLNDTFLNDAFSAKHQEIILTSTVSADKNPQYGYKTYPGNTTTDKVFLLSITEAEKYFSTDEERKCVSTKFAKAQGAYTSNYYTEGAGDAATCWWWLRTPGHFQGLTAYVNYDGSVDYSGDDVHLRNACVRPAMWINLD